VPLDDAAIDRIIDAVEHWVDDIEDPVQRVLFCEMDELVNVVIRAYATAHGVDWHNSGGGKATIRIEFDRGEKYAVKTEWL
jgi:hypothetical protein